MQKRLTFFIALFIGFSSLAQVNLDSLWNVWNDITQPDTSRLKAMKEIVWDGYLYTQPDSAFYFGQLQYDLAERTGHKKWMASALNVQGKSFYEKNDYDLALSYYRKSLKINEEIGDKRRIANSYNNIGLIYRKQGNYEKALEYFLKSLAIKKELGDKKGMGASYNTIGVIYQEKGNYDKAISYYKKSLKIKEETGSTLNNIGLIYQGQGNYDEAFSYFKRSLKLFEKTGHKYGIASALNNIGMVFDDKGNADKALNYHKKSLKVREEIGDKIGIAGSLTNIGVIYDEKGNYEEGLNYYKKSLKIYKEIDHKRGMTVSLNNIGQIYKDQDNFKEAIIYLLDALSISKEINALHYVEHQSKVLYGVYKELGNTDKALELYELYISTKDTLAKQDAMEEGIRLEEKRKYNEKKIIDSTAHIIAITKEKENVTRKEAELQIKKDQEVMLYGGLGLVVLFSLFIFNRFRVTYKQKNLIETQHHELNETHREITDSINYAKRIQSAILPQIKVVKEYLKESFILYKPKDVVAGDFYWMEQKDGKVLFAAADCTGHGVPGAMVSVLFVITDSTEA